MIRARRIVGRAVKHQGWVLRGHDRVLPAEYHEPVKPGGSTLLRRFINTHRLLRPRGSR